MGASAVTGREREVVQIIKPIGKASSPRGEGHRTWLSRYMDVKTERLTALRLELPKLRTLYEDEQNKVTSGYETLLQEHGDLEEAVADLVETEENADPEADYIVFTGRNGEMRSYTPRRLKLIIRKKIKKVEELEFTLGELDAVR